MMKKKVLALFLSLALLMTVLVYAETPEEPSVTEPGTQTENSEPEQLPPTVNENGDGESGEQKAPETPEEPENPESPDGQDAPAQPEEPENPDNPETPVTPTEPEEPAVPGTPENPENPGMPGEPVNPENPEDPEVPTEPEEPVFTARVKVELKPEGQLYVGDEVTLVAVVEDASAAYTVRWEYYDVEASEEAKEDVWAVLSTGEKYTFTVDQENALLTYRAVVNDLIVCEYRLPTVLERPVQDDQENTGDGEKDPEGEENDPSETEPAPDEEPSVSEGDAPVLNPDRSISIQMAWEGEALHYGDEITLTAVLNGYDNAVYTLQWQTSKDNETWTDVEGAIGASYTTVVTKENALDAWRVAVTVTGLTAAEAPEV